MEGPLNNLQESMISLPKPRISSNDKRLNFTALGHFNMGLFEPNAGPIGMGGIGGMGMSAIGGKSTTQITRNIH